MRSNPDFDTLNNQRCDSLFPTNGKGAGYNHDLEDAVAYCRLLDLPEHQTEQQIADADWAVGVLVNGGIAPWMDTMGRDRLEYMSRKLARILCDAGISSPDMLVALADLHYAHEQQEMVAAIGCCQGGCQTRHLIQTRDGQTVCRRTGQGCPWNDDDSLAIAKMFDWQGTVSIKERKVCPLTPLA